MNDEGKDWAIREMEAHKTEYDHLAERLEATAERGQPGDQKRIVAYQLRTGCSDLSDGTLCAWARSLLAE